MSISRRSLLKIGSSALAAGALGFPELSHAAGSIVATTYPGSFDEGVSRRSGAGFLEGKWHGCNSLYAAAGRRPDRKDTGLSQCAPV